ncbi:acetyl-CoA carboxylase biotin carboxylase subunit family protein [Streptacidiphilus sp. MAP5-3]|uniref:ATP-grasp domain-containing protein n=1 Tax=unclassified Streptacidiphilus TaxID=2643834 RepID=UPI003518B78A
MKILVIHQVPYRKIDYRLGIDHAEHEVTYIGHPHRMADLPADLPARRIELDAHEDLVGGVTRRTSPADGYQKVLSLSEFGILQAWQVRQHLGLDGPSLRQLERVRDKVAMKEALAESGIRYPRFVAAPPPCGPLPWSGRTVVKPRQGASSEGVTIHDTAREALVAYRRLENPKDYQLEEYVEGAILHADGLVGEGRLLELVVSRYVNRPVDFAAGEPLGSYQLPQDERHFAFAAQVVEALEIAEGAIHLEMFETEQGELVFLEVANRMGGAGVLQAHLGHTGVHLPAHEIAIRLGLPRPEPAPSTGRYHAWLCFPGHHLGAGAEHRIEIPEHLRVHPAVDVLHTLAPGAPLPDHITYQEWLVPVFIEASSEDSVELGRFLTECARAVRVGTATPAVPAVPPVPPVPAAPAAPVLLAAAVPAPALAPDVPALSRA